MELRLHGTVLYNSIYRADDQLLVNPHVYGVMANNAPVFQLRKIPGGEMASTGGGVDGRVVERGTHASLLAQRGLYSELYETQFADQEADGPQSPAA